MAGALSALWDGSTLATVATAAIIVVRGSYLALSSLRLPGQAAGSNDVGSAVELTSQQALLVPLGASGMLLCMFFFFAQIQVCLSLRAAVANGRLHASTYTHDIHFPVGPST